MKKAKVIHLYNTNSSPLWQALPIKMLNLAEELVDDEYFAYLGGLCGAEIVILMGQMDDSSGVIAISEEGQYIEIPPIPNEWFSDKTDEEIEEWISGFDPKTLAKMVFQHYQKTQQ